MEKWTTCQTKWMNIYIMEGSEHGEMDNLPNKVNEHIYI